MKPDLLTDKAAFAASRAGDEVVWYYKHIPEKTHFGKIKAISSDLIHIIWADIGGVSYSYGSPRLSGVTGHEWVINNLTQSEYIDEWAEELKVEI